MSHGRQRGGKWGMNFISSSGPRNSLSTVGNTSECKRNEDSYHKSPSGLSSTLYPKSGGASVPPPPSGYGLSYDKNYSLSGEYSMPQPVILGRNESVSAINPDNSNRAFANLGRKRVADEDDYFLDVTNENDNEYTKNDQDSDDSEDPLDRYMENINNEIHHLKHQSKDGKIKKLSTKGVRDDIEQEDEIESYMRFMEENPNVGLFGDNEDDVYEYDADGNIIGTEKKAIDPLPPIDHSVINYAPFAKNFYIEHDDIARLDEAAVEELRLTLNLRVSGPGLLRPVCSFGHLGFDNRLMDTIRKAGFVHPTPIQAQAVPLAMAGRDLIGIGKTGSGKTAAFLWPLIIHVLDQPELKLGDGPIAVVCAPTRELALQIYTEAKKLAKVYNLAVVCAYGGGNLWEQQKACESGCEILICTPGRLIDVVKKKSTNLRRVTYLVFDEADKMFNLGFALLFSATFKSRLERLARDILTDPVRIVEGDLGGANQDITQIVEIFDKYEEKWNWLIQNIVKFTTEGSVLVFVTRKVHSEEVAEKLKLRDLKVLLIHGDMHQSERNTVIQSFKRQEAPILVATDVASRGLDIPSIQNVINFEVARDIDTHTHRVGRTGRAGSKGTAFTLIIRNRDSVEFAACLVQHLQSVNQRVPSGLMDMAMKCSWFENKQLMAASVGSQPPKPSFGFEPRARPGLGLNDSTTTRDTMPARRIEGESSSENWTSCHSDRLSAMRSAFSSQYNRRFISAGIEATRYTHPEMLKSSTNFLAPETNAKQFRQT